MIYRTTPFSMTLNDPYPHFQGHAILWCWISQKRTTCRDSVTEILIRTYTRPTQQSHFEWPSVILSDIAKYSMTQSVAQSLCDSWASCLLSKHICSTSFPSVWLYHRLFLYRAACAAYASLNLSLHYITLHNWQPAIVTFFYIGK